MDVWFKTVVVGALVTLGCGEDGGRPPGGTGAASGASGSAGALPGGRGGKAGNGAGGNGARAGGSADAGAGRGQDAGGGGEAGGNGARAGGGNEGGRAANGGRAQGGRAGDEGEAGDETAPAGGTSTGGSTAEGGEAGLGASGDAGHEAGGDAGQSAGGTAGAGAAGGGAGLGGGGTAGAGAGGAGGAGGSEPLPVECVVDGDCDSARGASPCGSWHCTSAGGCEAESPGCTDADGDGYGAGATCACAGLDCDDDDSDVFDRARETCALGTGPHGGCFSSVRLCHAGAWGPCKAVPGEQLPGGEACNGEDDDCDGDVDEALGSVSCGHGACRRSVRACRGGTIQVCVPGTPATASDGCNGVDDDCDGSTDEDCGECVHVAPDGDDGAAAASAGATPFRNVQPAIDFAATNPSAPRRICVAAGATCGANTAFPGPDGADLTLADGLSMLGGYESTTWARCTSSTTRLLPQTGVGVAFSASISSGAVLDGFSIERLAATTTSGITVDGAQGVVISNVSIENGPASTTSYGVRVSGGGDALIVRSRITGGAGTALAVGVQATGARVVLEDNCRDLDPTTGRCDDDCATGPSIQGRNSAQFYESYGIVLNDAPGSRVERSAVCAQALGDNEGPGLETHVAALTIAGNGDDIVVGRSNLTATTAAGRTAYGVTSAGCAGAKPWLVDNHSILSSGQGIQASALRFAGDCHPVIDSNRELVAIMEGSVGPESFALVCAAASSVGSRCVISGNADVHAGGDAVSSSQRGGILCDGACAKIVGNEVTARTLDYRGMRTCGTIGTTCQIAGRGLVLDESGAFVDRNRFSLGCTRNGVALRVTDSWSRIQNNYAIGRSDTACTLIYSVDQPALIESRGDANEVDVHSNNFAGNPYFGSDCSSPTNYGLQVAVLSPAPSGPRGIFRNNRIQHVCGNSNSKAFVEMSTAADPRVFENNALYPSFAGDCPYQGDTGPGDFTGLSCIDKINAFTDITSSGNILGDQLLDLYDSGTSEDAPLWDFYGTPRDDTPSIGAYEYPPLP